MRLTLTSLAALMVTAAPTLADKVMIGYDFRGI